MIAGAGHRQARPGKITRIGFAVESQLRKIPANRDNAVHHPVPPRRAPSRHAFDEAYLTCVNELVNQLTNSRKLRVCSCRLPQPTRWWGMSLKRNPLRNGPTHLESVLPSHVPRFKSIWAAWAGKIAKRDSSDLDANVGACGLAGSTNGLTNLLTLCPSVPPRAGCGAIASARAELSALGNAGRPQA